MAKKIDAEKLRWLKSELAELKEAGVVDEATVGKIGVYYESSGEDRDVLPHMQPEDSAVPAVPETTRLVDEEKISKTRTRSYSQIILVALGALLIGAGVILFFAYNWDMMSPLTRLTVAFIPAIAGALCGIYTIIREKDARWREFSAFSCATGFAVATAIVSQVYHTGGTLFDYTVLMMTVTLPLIYIFQAQLLTLVYCYAICYFMMHYEARLAVIDWGAIFIVAVAPWLCYNLFLRKPRGMNAVLARYAALGPLAYFTFHYGHPSVLTFFSAACTLYIAGLYYSEKEGTNGFANPWLLLGWLFFTGSLLWFSLEFGSYGGVYSVWIVIPLILGLFLAHSRQMVLPAVVALAPSMFTLAVSTMAAGRGDIAFMSNVLLAFAAFAAFRQGLKSRSIFIINAGMLQIALLAAFRFFDPRISMLLRSFVFIALGVAFICVNIRLGRRFVNERKLADAAGGNKDE